MELAPSTEPWTAAVAWARPWRRPAAETAWTAAVAEHRAAREVLAAIELGPEPGMDVWLEAVARQDMFRARRQLRRAQEALTGADADLPWSSC